MSADLAGTPPELVDRVRRRLASTLRIELTTGEAQALAKEARLDRMQRVAGGRHRRVI